METCLAKFVLSSNMHQLSNLVSGHGNAIVTNLSWKSITHSSIYFLLNSIESSILFSTYSIESRYKISYDTSTKESINELVDWAYVARDRDFDIKSLMLQGINDVWTFNFMETSSCDKWL